MTATISDREPRPACLPEELRANTLFLLARLGFTIKARVLEEFEEAGFTMYEYSVLAILAEGASEAQATIADVLSLDRSQLVGVLDNLEERGLIERKRDPKDRRRHQVSLTPAGKREFGKLRAIVRKVDASILEPLDEEARKSLHKALLTVATHNDARFGPTPK
jgi:MarR family transcriptional regulator, lower aerobic nicotinate degradation pathway regulator